MRGKWSLLGIGCVAAIAGSTPLPAQQPATHAVEPAVAFGAREEVAQASLSPDGARLAYLTPLAGQGSAVMILDLKNPDAEPVPVTRTDGEPERLSSCHWVAASRLMCKIFVTVPYENDIVYASRFVAVDTDGKRAKMLAMPVGASLPLSAGSVIDWNPGREGHVLIARQNSETPDMIGFGGGGIAASQFGLRVDLLDTATLKYATVETSDPEAQEYIADGQGHIRIVGRVRREGGDGYDDGAMVYWFRLPGTKDWRLLNTAKAGPLAFTPYAVDGPRNLAFGLKRVNGRLAAFSKALDGSGTETLLFADPQVDVADFVRIGRRGRVVGVTYVTDRRQVKYFDPALEKIAASLARALPQTPLIRFVDASEDENTLLLWAGGDTNPGRYFLFDRAAMKLDPLLDDRPALRGVTLATMTTVSYPAADGTTIPAYLTLPPAGARRDLPAIVLPHGGPSARDEWGFDWLAQFFAARGYAVLQPNFRGSAGYGDVWFQKNGYRGWRTVIGDVDDAGRWLVKQGIADPTRMAIVGWSYGGYAALQAGVVEPDLFKAIVAIAPVTDFGQLRQQGEMFTDYYTQRDAIGSGSHLTEGSPARNVERIKAPVLLFHGDHDGNVSIVQSRLMQQRLQHAGKRSELITYRHLDHYLDDGDARADLLKRTDAFLKTALAR